MGKQFFKVGPFSVLTVLPIVSLLFAVTSSTRAVAERVAGQVSIPEQSLVSLLNPKASCETECCDYCCNWYCPSTEFSSDSTQSPITCPTLEPCECEFPSSVEPPTAEPCICPTTAEPPIPCSTFEPCECHTDPPEICPTQQPCECSTEPPMTTCPTREPCDPCPTCPPPEQCPTTPTTASPCTTVTPPTCPPIPTCPPCQTTPTPPPPTDNPVFSKVIYQSSLPSWPIAGTTVHLGLNATSEDNAPIRYELITSFEFLTLSGANDIIFISNVSDGAYVGPNNVMVIEVVATVIGDESRTDRAAIVIVFPRSVTDETF